jgi:hypothetical protein
VLDNAAQVVSPAAADAGDGQVDRLHDNIDCGGKVAAQGIAEALRP